MNDKNSDAWDQLFSEIGNALIIPFLDKFNDVLILIKFNDVLRWFSGWLTRLLRGK